MNRQENFSFYLRMYGTHVLNQTFDSIRMSVLRDAKKNQ